MKQYCFMMIGLPGSGKSHQAEKLSKEYNARIFSSDKYRAVLGSSEEDQTVTPLVFDQLHKDLLQALRDGENVIFDATNINSKKRRSFLNSIKNIQCEKIGILMLRTFDNLINICENRDRKVSKHVITRMYKAFETPYLEEGFDNIDIIYTDNDEGCFGLPYKVIDNLLDYDQNNKYHTMTLGNHLQNTQDYIIDHFAEILNKYPELYFAAMLHDCGKPFCRSDTTYKGIVDGYSHYINHESVGAYNSLFYDYQDSTLNKLLISFLISNHMKPLNWCQKKTEEKYKKYWGDEKFDLIKKLNEADRNAH